MTRRSSILALVALLVASAPLLAAPPIVNLMLHPGNPRTIEVKPNVTAACRNEKKPSDNPSCPTSLNFRWLGAPGQDDSERLSVFYKDGLYWDAEGNAAVVPAEKCFSFPDGQNPFALARGEARLLVLRQDEETCPDKVAFFFEISCQNKAMDNCGGVETLDPGTMIDNGRR